MTLRIPVFYGSYRRDRKGIRLADYLTRALAERGAESELVDARAVGLPLLDRMYKEHAPGTVPENMERVASSIRAADACLFVCGEYNHGVQPGLKNLTDHFLEEWFGRPAAIASYSMGALAGVRAMLGWRAILAEMGMPTISSVLAVGQVHQALDEDGQPQGDAGAALARRFERFARELEWWAEAARRQRADAGAPLG
jgi:NAD(P)H-dependent FMN reductase